MNAILLYLLLTKATITSFSGLASLPVLREDLVVRRHLLTDAQCSILRKASLDPKRPSILLAHAPDQLRIAEEEGISLQLSGHTHRGQFFPWTWITSRIYGPFVYGLKRLGRLLVYTTSGAGTWGPPMRLGAAPELVLIHFESSPVAHSTRSKIDATKLRSEFRSGFRQRFHGFVEDTPSCV